MINKKIFKYVEADIDTRSGAAIGVQTFNADITNVPSDIEFNNDAASSADTVTFTEPQAFEVVLSCVQQDEDGQASSVQMTFDVSASSPEEAKSMAMQQAYDKGFTSCTIINISLKESKAKSR